MELRGVVARNTPTNHFLQPFRFLLLADSHHHCVRESTPNGIKCLQPLAKTTEGHGFATDRSLLLGPDTVHIGRLFSNTYKLLFPQALYNESHTECRGELPYRNEPARRGRSKLQTFTS